MADRATVPTVGTADRAAINWLPSGDGSCQSNRTFTTAHSTKKYTSELNCGIFHTSWISLSKTINESCYQGKVSIIKKQQSTVIQFTYHY
jgi:hypothetical protein